MFNKVIPWCTHCLRANVQGKAKRNFVQTFFLAVQERGYFVLNDLFRYLAEAKTLTPAGSSEENGFPLAHPPDKVRV